MKLENTVERHLIEADMLAKKAEKNNDFSLLTQSNALRSKVSKLQKDIESESANIVLLDDKLKRCATE